MPAIQGPVSSDDLENTLEARYADKDADIGRKHQRAHFCRKWLLALPLDEKERNSEQDDKQACLNEE